MNCQTIIPYFSYVRRLCLCGKENDKIPEGVEEAKVATLIKPFTTISLLEYKKEITYSRNRWLPTVNNVDVIAAFFFICKHRTFLGAKIIST